MLDEKILLKVSPLKGVMKFEKKEKFSSRFIESFEIFEKFGDVVFRLVLPQHLSDVHHIFYVSILKKYHPDDLYLIRSNSVTVDHDLSYEEEHIVILDRQTRKIRSKHINSAKLQWRHRSIEEAICEIKSDIQSGYPPLFTDSGNLFAFSCKDELVF